MHPVRFLSSDSFPRDLAPRTRVIADLLPHVAMLLCGVLLAWFGGEWFVKGGVSLALWARWPTAIVGATVAAFGTSSPEMMVAIHAARSGVPQIALGDIMGSNVINVSLVLAIVVAMAGLRTGGKDVMRDWGMALVLPVLLGWIFYDGLFSRGDAAVLLLCFSAWMFRMLKDARAHARAHRESGEHYDPAPLRKTLIFLLIGLIMLIGAAQLVVHGGQGVAQVLGWSNFIVGVVVVAIATSTPELATTLIARMRGHDEVGLGNILGSNIFNMCIVAALIALIRPCEVSFEEVWPSLAFSFGTVLLIFPGRNSRLGRIRGFLLLGCYVAFVVFTLRSGGSTAVH